MIQLKIPVTYKITDYNGEDYKDRFTNYSCKRRRRTHSESKSIKRQGEKSLVKWMRYPKSFNSWIDTKTIEKGTTEKSL